jgi:hypothetical protein
MLTRTSAMVILANAALLLLSACGAGKQEATVGAVPTITAPSLPAASDASTVCQTAAQDPKINDNGAASVTVVMAKSTTNAALDSWLRDKNGNNDPSNTAKRYPALAAQAPTDPVTFCLLKDPDLAIPYPSPPPQRAEGLEVFVTGPGSYTIGPMGQVPQLTQMASALQSTAPATVPSSVPSTAP